MLHDAAAVTDPEPSAVDLGALRGAPLQTDPFEYVVVPGFVTPEAIAAANRDFPEIEKPANYDPDTITRRYVELVRDVIAESEPAMLTTEA